MLTLMVKEVYDEAKRFAEATTATIVHIILTLKLLEYLNIWSKNAANDGRVVTNFIVQALNSKDITIYGDGSQTRSFSYVEDTVNGIIALMKSDHNDVFNIGNPNEITVNQLASTIIKLTNSILKL